MAANSEVSFFLISKHTLAIELRQSAYVCHGLKVGLHPRVATAMVPVKFSLHCSAWLPRNVPFAHEAPGDIVG